MNRLMGMAWWLYILIVPIIAMFPITRAHEREMRRDEKRDETKP